eukprot:scaffold2200_cov112-Cylindrotheca_fusiformis.AAC.2
MRNLAAAPPSIMPTLRIRLRTGHREVARVWLCTVAYFQVRKRSCSYLFLHTLLSGNGHLKSIRTTQQNGTHQPARHTRYLNLESKTVDGESRHFGAVKIFFIAAKEPPHRSVLGDRLIFEWISMPCIL